METPKRVAFAREVAAPSSPSSVKGRPEAVATTAPASLAASPDVVAATAAAPAAAPAPATTTAQDDERPGLLDGGAPAGEQQAGCWNRRPPPAGTSAQPLPQRLRVLALGDSYTIGESVSASQSFPNELARLLADPTRAPHYEAVDVTIVAKTGWTTDELLKGIEEAHLVAQPAYDLVTLLVGVNNQYRGRSSTDYGPEFEVLLQKAIEFAGNRRRQVVVLSIPDWGVTPFAKNQGRNLAQIATQIDEFNQVNAEIAKRKYKVGYIDVTPWTREASGDASLLAEDGLHPSAKEYERWAELVFERWQLVHRKTLESPGTTTGDQMCGFIPVESTLTGLFKGLGLL